MGLAAHEGEQGHGKDSPLLLSRVDPLDVSGLYPNAFGIIEFRHWTL